MQPAAGVISFSGAGDGEIMGVTCRRAALGLDRAAEVTEDRVSARSSYEHGGRGWENVAIEAFLGATVVWSAIRGVRPACSEDVSPGRPIAKSGKLAPV